MTDSTLDISSPYALGNADIRKLLRHYAMPSIVAMVTSSIYNIVDSIFIGHGVGAMAIAGLAVTFPLMNLSAAFGTLVGVGGASLMSIRLGQQDKDSAFKILGNLFLLNVILGLIIAILGLIFLDPILRLFGASDETMIYALPFMRILLYGNVITHLYFGLNALLRSSGYPRKAMNIPLISILINCALAPLFIFVFKWGIKGAALATVLSQCVGFINEFVHYSNHNSFVYFTKKCFKFESKLALQMISIGLAPFLLNVCACIVVIFINNALKDYGGDLAIGAYGIVNRLIMLFVMIVSGITQGMQPIVGYNFGAKKYDRLKSILLLGMKVATCVTTFGFGICMLFPRQLAMMFTDDQSLLKVASGGLRIVTLLFPLNGITIVTSNFFQSIGHSGKAIILSMTRQLIFIVPLLIILPPLLGTKGVWLSMPIADAVSFILALLLLIREMQQLKKSMINNN